MQEDVLNAAARDVLADKTRQWRRLVFEEALALQARNPDMRRAALLAPSDHVEAGERLVLLLAMGMNPAAIRECIAWCEFVEAELADPVAPVAHTPGVDNERDGGGGQQHDRAVNDRDVEQDEDRLAELSLAELRHTLAALTAKAERLELLVTEMLRQRSPQVRQSA